MVVQQLPLVSLHSPFSYGTTRFLSVVLGCDAVLKMSFSPLLPPHILTSAFQSSEEELFVSSKLCSPRVFPKTKAELWNTKRPNVCVLSGCTSTASPRPAVRFYSQSSRLWVFFLCRKALGVGTGESSLCPPATDTEDEPASSSPAPPPK